MLNVYIPDVPTAQKIILTMFSEVQKMEIKPIFNTHGTDEGFRICAHTVLPTLASNREINRILGETIVNMANEMLQGRSEDDPLSLKFKRQIEDTKKIMRQDELAEAQVIAACGVLGIELAR